MPLPRLLRVAAAALLLLIPTTVSAQTRTATGTFDVQLTPAAADSGVSIGRMAIAKQFHGDIQGTSAGQMLAMTTSVDGSAGYVAMEEVRATVHGRSGTFVLQHSGTMQRGVPTLLVSVVPDSGTGELAGLAGTMAITITGREHRYAFTYTIAP